MAFNSHFIWSPPQPLFSQIIILCLLSSPQGEPALFASGSGGVCALPAPAPQSIEELPCRDFFIELLLSTWRSLLICLRAPKALEVTCDHTSKNHRMEESNMCVVLTPHTSSSSFLSDASFRLFTFYISTLFPLLSARTLMLNTTFTLIWYFSSHHT